MSFLVVVKASQSKVHTRQLCMREDIASVRAGISFTDDKLLQWRLVAYDDAQVGD